MPTISMFYGIIVSMFFEIKEKHHLPHVHVRYQDARASIAIEDGAVLAGEFPNRQLRMVQVWMISIGMNCWRIGNLRSPVKSCSGLTLSGKEA